MFRHGLRVSEACALQLKQVDTESSVMHVARLKKGLSTTHPLRAGELRVIKAWLADRATMKATGRAFFISSTVSPLTGAPHGWRSAITGSWPGLPCLLTRTSSGTLAASPWPTRARTRG